MNRDKASLIELYGLAKANKVGETAICPSCKTLFVKSQYQQIFCKTKKGTICKDNYWNNVIPNKRNNKTRISPASLRYLMTKDIPIIYGYGDSQKEIDKEDRYNDYLNSGDGMDVTVERCEWCGCLTCRCETCDSLFD